MKGMHKNHSHVACQMYVTNCCQSTVHGISFESSNIRVTLAGLLRTLIVVEGILEKQGVHMWT